MTKIECLQKTQLVWGYLANRPKMNKKTAYQILDLDYDYLYCSCCAYAHAHHSTPDVCAECPLKDFWPAPQHVCYVDGPEQESAFRMWNDTFNSDEIRAEAAQSIHDAAITALITIYQLQGTHKNGGEYHAIV